jgi:hypothetical protein
MHAPDIRLEEWPPAAGRVRNASATAGRMVRLCVYILGVMVLAAVAADVLLALFHIPLDPREGWNAYHADAVFSGALYPRPPSMLYNNYPPLSFLVAGATGKLTGDNIIAGRVIALLSTAVTAFVIRAMARAMGCGRSESIFAALLFLASPWLLSEFGGIDDPQMLGQAIGSAGFALLVADNERRFTWAGALLLVLAGFVKPIFLSQPLALLIWFAIADRRSAIRFAAFGLAYTATGVAATDWLFGTGLVAHIVSSRVYDLSATVSHPGTWLLTGLVPLAASLYLLRISHDRYAQLCAIYAVVALICGAFFSGGEGVGGNAMFDASIAVSLGAAVFVNRMRRGATPPKWLGDRAAVFVALISTAALGLDFVAQTTARISDLRYGNSFFVQTSSPRQTVLADIQFLGGRSGATLCETLALCYWANKAPEVDAFNLTQAFKRHSRKEQDLVGLLDNRHYATVELDRRSHFNYSPLLHCAFARNYRLHHADQFGVFLVPRDTNGVRPAASAGDCSSDFDRFLSGYTK